MHKNRKQNNVRAGWLRQSHRGGFTLIELMIVLLIMAVAAAIAVPMVSSAGSMQIRSAANMVAADLEYAKSLAIGTGQRHSVVFDADNEAYSITNASGTTVPHPVKKGFDYVVNFAADGRLDQVDIVDVNFDGTGTVSFDYLGSSYNGAGSGLSSGTVTLRASGVTRTVSVEPVTGFISISD